MNLRDLFRKTVRSTVSLRPSAGRTESELMEELEEQLVLADLSLALSSKLIEKLRRQKVLAAGEKETLQALRRELALVIRSAPLDPPVEPGQRQVIVLLGVNGSGKTTTAAKLAWHHQQRGRKVLLAAADTFRAAGASQLEIWAGELALPIISGQRGTDPGAVVYNSLQAFLGRDHDLLIIDTAGRLHNRENLMMEAQKIINIVARTIPGEPCQTLLVLDAATGQNALAQAEKFRDFAAVNGLILTRFDGTAKGGSIVSIAAEMGLPVLALGCGEKAQDLLEFNGDDFINALLAE